MLSYYSSLGPEKFNFWIITNVQMDSTSLFCLDACIPITIFLFKQYVNLIQYSGQFGHKKFTRLL